jgi:hypothetical protein
MMLKKEIDHYLSIYIYKSNRSLGQLLAMGAYPPASCGVRGSAISGLSESLDMSGS